jgi:hypothetical protein
MKYCLSLRRTKNGEQTTSPRLYISSDINPSLQLTPSVEFIITGSLLFSELETSLFSRQLTKQNK